MTEGLTPISDLFGFERYLNPKGKPLDERGVVLKELSQLTDISIPQICGMFPQASLQDFRYFLSDARQARCGAKIALQHNAKEWNGRV